MVDEIYKSFLVLSLRVFQIFFKFVWFYSIFLHVTPIFLVWNAKCLIFSALTIKRKVNTKHKLPVLNWIVLKPNQVKGTIFNELDDEKILSVIVETCRDTHAFSWLFALMFFDVLL